MEDYEGAENLKPGTLLTFETNSPVITFRRKPLSFAMPTGELLEQAIFYSSPIQEVDGRSSPHNKAFINSPHETPLSSPRKSPRISRTSSSRFSPRSSPKSSPRKSPKRRTTSRLPIRGQPRFIVKELHLPPDESILRFSGEEQSASKVTPEKLMEALREEVAAVKQRKQNQLSHRELLKIDDEISIPILDSLQLSSPSGADGKSPLALKNSASVSLMLPNRISLRTHCSVTISAPDLPDEDPLEIARQTILNTKHNTGYRTCHLVFTSERVTRDRVESPEHAYSLKTGPTRHLLQSTSSECEEDSGVDSVGKRIKFDRILRIFEDYDDDCDLEALEEDSSKLPQKPCLKPMLKSDSNFAGQDIVVNENTGEKSVVYVKKILYGDEEDPLDFGGKRRFASSVIERRPFTGAKRAARKLVD